MFQFAYRGFTSPGRPAFFVFGTDFNDAMERLTNLGMAGFYTDDDLRRASWEEIPETTTLTGAEIEALPEYMKYFKCNGALEKGDCDGEHKYSSACYDVREGKASWHPG